MDILPLPNDIIKEIEKYLPDPTSRLIDSLIVLLQNSFENVREYVLPPDNALIRIRRRYQFFNQMQDITSWNYETIKFNSEPMFKELKKFLINQNVIQEIMQPDNTIIGIIIDIILPYPLTRFSEHPFLNIKKNIGLIESNQSLSFNSIIFGLTVRAFNY